jgi:hypothetical protein
MRADSLSVMFEAREERQNEIDSKGSRNLDRIGGDSGVAVQRSRVTLLRS